MPDDFSIEIDSKTLEQKFKSLSSDLQTRILNTSLREGAKVYQSRLREAAPVRSDGGPNKGSNSLPEGALESDVIIRKVPNAPEYDVQFGKQTSHIARFVNDGHRLVRGGRSTVNKKTGKTRGPGSQVGDVQAYPFFESAAESATGEAEQAITTSLTAQINAKWNE